MVLGFMLTLTGTSIIFRNYIEEFFNKFRKQHENDIEPHALQGKKRIYIVLMGIVLGIFVTLSSVGAGAFGVMALILLFPKLPMIRIIGSDVAHAVCLTFVAGLAHMSSGNVDIHLLGWLLTGSIPAIIIGTLISSKMPEKFIRKLLGFTLLLLGLNFILHPSKEKVQQTPKPTQSALQIVHHTTKSPIV